MDKATCRNIYKKSRLSMSIDECRSLDGQLLEHLKNLDLSHVSYLHVYLSMTKFNEPDTFSFIDFLKKNYPAIQLVISKTDFHNHTMVNYLWNEDLVLEENKWGILEPINGKICEEDLIDLVLIPLLIADMSGNRVGYGKGFYDRFLAQCKSTVQKVGVSYFTPIDKIDDVDEWDIPLTKLITPNRVYDYSNH